MEIILKRHCCGHRWEGMICIRAEKANNAGIAIEVTDATDVIEAIAKAAATAIKALID